MKAEPSISCLSSISRNSINVCEQTTRYYGDYAATTRGSHSAKKLKRTKDRLAVLEDEPEEPTAELLPPGNHRTDEAYLMPYELLDPIERLAVRDKLCPQEVLNEVAIGLLVIHEPS